MLRSFLVGLVVSAVLGGCGREEDDGGGPRAAPPAIPDPTHGPSTPGDIDGDGVANDDDNCPSVANADQRLACTYPERPAAGGGSVAADAVARINWTRTSVGLGPVAEDPALTRGCELHVAYLIAYAAEIGGPALSHTEDLSKPYASEEGNQAGVDSVLSYGQPNVALAVDGWINTLYHRLPLLHPGLHHVGAAYQDGFACVQYRRGTDAAARAPYPILWPPPDVIGTDRQFGGSESPCPTAEDPLGASDCPASAAIPTMSLHGSNFSGVTGTLIDLASGVEVPLFRTYFDGGPSPHEMAGYVEGSIALVPQPGSSLTRSLYEVTVQATVDGTPQTFRWRFRTARELPDVMCDEMGVHHDIAGALPIGSGDELAGRICDFGDVYRIEGSGPQTVSVVFDHGEGDIDLVSWDATGMELGRSDSQSDREELLVEGGNYVQVYGYMGGMGPYIIRVD